VCTMGHKRGPWGHTHGDVGLRCMSCDARMHGVANGTMESGVMRIGEELGRLTVDTLIALTGNYARSQPRFLKTSCPKKLVRLSM
jgi:hypothetical protein